MRATGRTTRIVNFAIEQLMNCGNVIVTDHATFEGHVPAQHMLINLVYENWTKLHADKMNWVRLNHREHQLRVSPIDPKCILKTVHFYLEPKSI